MQPDQQVAAPGCGRDPLIAAITAFLARDHLPRARTRGNRPLIMDAIGLSIAALLPPGYRGAYASASTEG